jgi:hypothetical protein
VNSIAPQAWLPADMPAFVQVAPVEVAWQLQPSQPEERTLTSPPPPPPVVIEAPAGSVMATVTWPLAAVPVSLTWKTTVPELPELWLHTLTVAVSCTVAGGGVGLGGLCVGCGRGLGGCDVTAGTGPDAECELLGAGLWLDVDLAGDGDGDAVGVVTLGDTASSACGLGLCEELAGLLLPVNSTANAMPKTATTISAPAASHGIAPAACRPDGYPSLTVASPPACIAKHAT